MINGINGINNFGTGMFDCKDLQWWPVLRIFAPSSQRKWVYICNTQVRKAEVPVCAFYKVKVRKGPKRHLFWIFYNIPNHCQTSVTCLHPEFPRSSVFALLCEVLIKATRNIFSSLRSYSNFNQLFILTHCVCCLLLYLVSSHRSEEISSPRLSREPSLVI